MSLLLSIVTINLNNLNGLKYTLESVFSQNLNQVEVIVVDGGSTDGSYEYLIKVIKSNFILISEKDTGIYNAMNKGINVSSGKYIYFLNSGDSFYDNQSLDIILKTINIQNKLSVLVFDVFIPNKGVIIQRNKINSFEVYKNYICHQGVVYPNVKRIYSENYKIISDWIYTIQMMKLFPVFYNNNIISVFEPGGISSTNISQKKEEFYRARRIVFPYYFLKSKGFIYGALFLFYFYFTKYFYSR